MTTTPPVPEELSLRQRFALQVAGAVFVIGFQNGLTAVQAAKEIWTFADLLVALEDHPTDYNSQGEGIQ